MKMYLIFLGVVLCVLPEVFGAFKPPGQYDLSMGEIVPLCKMVKKFAETGTPPDPEPFDATAGAGDDCIYFKWVDCEKPSSNPNKPCGWFEMTKCPTSRRKRSFYEYIERIKRNAKYNRPRPDGPVILGFPDEEFEEDQVHAI